MNYLRRWKMNKRHRLVSILSIVFGSVQNLPVGLPNVVINKQNQQCTKNDNKIIEQTNKDWIGNFICSLTVRLSMVFCHWTLRKTQNGCFLFTHWNWLEWFKQWRTKGCKKRQVSGFILCLRPEWSAPFLCRLLSLLWNLSCAIENGAQSGSLA